MEKKLLQKKLLTDSRQFLKDDQEQDDISEEFAYKRNRSDSLPTDHLNIPRVSRRQSLPSHNSGVEDTEKLLKEGILKLQNSAKNVDSAKRTVKELMENRRTSSPVPQLRIEDERISDEDPPAPTPAMQISSGEGNFVTKIGRWIKGKIEERSATKSAEKDVKRAVKGVSEAGEVLNQMEDSLIKKEEELCVRALALRRQSADTFKLVSTGIKAFSIPSNENVTEEEEEEKDENRKEKYTSDENESAGENSENIDKVVKEVEGKSLPKKKYYEQEVTNL